MWLTRAVGCGKKRLYARAKWHFGDGRSYCTGCTELNPLCPFHKCRYTETTPQTVEGYQAWEVLLKLSEPSLSLALDVARNLGFDMDIMSELLPIEILAIKQNLNDMTKTDNN
ncbi:MAG: hypothetical protein IJ529_02435 [Alphaproteobacteria bacterium]|nr:hypothetical protein [Alphaproteobacteria bacterium]